MSNKKVIEKVSEVCKNCIHDPKMIYFILGVIMCIMGIILAAVIPVIYWIMNPTLTQMQVFLHKWYLAIGGIILVLVGMWIVENTK